MKFILMMILLLPSLGKCLTEKKPEEILPNSIVIFLSQKTTPLNKIQEKINTHSICHQSAEREFNRTPAVVEMFGVKRKINSATVD